MANAVLDLPDPLQSEPAARADAAAAGGADDLLSEMVGDEIDRLLADADAKPPRAPADSGPDVGAELPPPRAFDTSSLDEKLKPQPDSTTDAMSPTTAQELDEILSSVNSLIKEVDPATDDAPTKPYDAEPEVDAAPVPVAASVVIDHDLDPPVAAAAEAAPPRDKHATPDPAVIDTPVESPTPQPRVRPAESGPGPELAEAAPQSATLASPLPDNPPAAGALVRVLQWINKPFESCPPAARDAMGKIGVATLINAAGILLYVYWIHPHR